MGTMTRATLALVIGAATFMFGGWIATALLGTRAFPVSLIVPAAGAFLLALYVWRSSGRLGGSSARRAVGYALAGGVVAGAIGLGAGFLGPLLFAPQANQGPLLGIFIAGPIGFVAGAVGGWIRGINRRGS